MTWEKYAYVLYTVKGIATRKAEFLNILISFNPGTAETYHQDHLNYGYEYGNGGCGKSHRQKISILK